MCRRKLAHTYQRGVYGNIRGLGFRVQGLGGHVAFRVWGWDADAKVWGFTAGGLRSTICKLSGAKTGRSGLGPSKEDRISVPRPLMSYGLNSHHLSYYITPLYNALYNPAFTKLDYSSSGVGI